jgi:hypothetical protein
MADQNETIPAKTGTVKVTVTDANGNDITGNCTFKLVSNDSDIVKLGDPDLSTPDIYPVTGVKAGIAAVSVSATNSAGFKQKIDTLTVIEEAPHDVKTEYNFEDTSAKGSL